MGSMKDLLGDQLYESSYPAAPGYKEPTTSRDAARRIAPNAAALRTKVLAAIARAGERGLTADEAAEAVGAHLLAIRPRVTELGPKHEGKIRKNGQRRANESGAMASVWVLA